MATSDEQDEFPTAAIPVVFTDGFISASWSPQVVKLYYGVQQPSLNASGNMQLQCAGQLVTPVNGFIDSVEFFLNLVVNMKEGGSFSSDQIDYIGKMLKEKTSKWHENA